MSHVPQDEPLWVLSDPFILPNGVLLASLAPNPYYTTWDKSWGLPFSIVWKNKSGNYQKLYTMDNRELFDRVKEPLMKIFSKLYSVLEPSEVNTVKPMTVSKNAFKDINSVMNVSLPPRNVLSLIDDMNCTPIESAFMTLMWDSAAGQFSNTSAEDLKQIIHSHITYFNEATFDSGVKIQAALHPWEAQLGVENFEFLNMLEFSDEELDVLKDKEIMMFFKNLFNVIYCFDDHKNFRFSELDNLEVKDLANPSRERTSKMNEFFKLPIYSKDFRDAFSLLTVSESRIIWKNFPSNISPEIFIEWMEHHLQGTNERFDPEAFLLLEEFSENVLNKLELYNDEYETIQNSILDRAGWKGYTEVALKYFCNYWTPGTFEQFSEINKKLLNNNELAYLHTGPISWITDPRFADFVLFKLGKDIGVKEAIETILIASENDVPLTFNQWLALPSHYQLLKDSPFSWWSSIIGDGKNKQ